MSVFLITGLPGSGKTQKMLLEAERLGKEGRQVYWANIRGLDPSKVPGWKECNPREWRDLPDGSVVVVDEIQDFWPQRGPRDPIPAEVKALDKHRHRGFSFVFTCQYPKQVDFALREFVDRHVHMRRVFGMKRSMTLEHPHQFDIDDKSAIYKAIKGQFAFPKHVWSWYESATEHNMKAKLPWRVIAFPVIALGAVALGILAVRYVLGFGDKMASITAGPQAAATKQGSQSTDVGSALMGDVGKAKKSGAELSGPEAFRPRVAGFMHTAPRYDDVAKPVRVPYPAGCVVLERKGCKCWTQQATPYTTTDAICRQIAAYGFFLDFDPEPGADRQRRAEERPAAVFGVGQGVGGGLGVIEAPAPRQTVASRLGGAK